MKEATGGALLMGLAAGIILIFIIMVAFFISYGQTFRLKNDMINYIEQNEGVDKETLANYMVGKGSVYSGRDIKACYKEVNRGSEQIGFTVKVIVYMQMDRNIFGKVFNPKIPVSGETKTIETGNYVGDPSSLGIANCNNGYSGEDTYSNVLVGGAVAP